MNRHGSHIDIFILVFGKQANKTSCTSWNRYINIEAYGCFLSPTSSQRIFAVSLTQRRDVRYSLGLPEISIAETLITRGIIVAKQDRTNWWSRAQVIGGILTPIVIAGATGYINHQIAERARQEELQRDKLSRLALVPSFIDALTGNNEKKRVLAVRIISQVLPDDAPALLDGVIEARPNTLEAEIAQDEIRLAPFRQLATGIYAASYSDRSSAFQQFLTSPGAASDKIAVLLDQIRQSPWHLDGTANAWRLLISFDGKDLVPFLERIRVLEHLTKGNGPQTEDLARRVRIKAEAAVSH